MLTVRKLTPELMERLRPISDASLAGEEVMLRIGRSGFTLGYVPLPRAEWRSFPMVSRAEPARLLADPNAAILLAFEDDTFVGQDAVASDGETVWTEIIDIRVDAAHRRQGVAR
ncbi:MAG: GNAT family N-acetyltransferase, partial [Clostridia bacterium]|nr:GNAT family N-acetyltransferase [Clostridia bacterium]